MRTADRREFIQTTGASLGLAGLGLQSSSTMSGRRGQAKRPPHIILIMVDDMGYSDLGCYGGEILTPNLDRMATDGLRFTQFYNMARCCPTRASVLTGLQPHQAGVGYMTWGLKAEEHPGYVGHLNKQCVTVAEALRLAGYRTAISGKWHVGDTREYWPLQRGFEKNFGLSSGGQTTGGHCSYFEPSVIKDNEAVTLDDEDFYFTDAISDATVEYIDEFAKGDSPFFLYTAYTAPHWPLHALPEDIAKYRDVYKKGWDALRAERHARMIEMGLLEPSCELTPREENVPAWKDEPHKEWQIERMAIYAAQIDRMDQGIGRIMAKLKATGQDENTLVLFLSDNGAASESWPPGIEKAVPKLFPKFAPDGRLVRAGNDPSIMPGDAATFATYGPAWANASNTPFRLFKTWIHEGGISTPLIAHWPNVIKKGGRTDELGQVIDIMATCLDVAGAEYPKSYEGHDIKPLEGKSLAPIFRNGTREGHREICWEHQGNRAIRQGKWKLVSRYPNTWELYDIEADRGEMNNVAERYPAKVEELTELYDEWANRCDVLPWDDIKEKLEKAFWEQYGESFPEEEVV